LFDGKEAIFLAKGNFLPRIGNILPRKSNKYLGPNGSVAVETSHHSFLAYLYRGCALAWSTSNVQNTYYDDRRCGKNQAASGAWATPGLDQDPHSSARLERPDQTGSDQRLPNAEPRGAVYRTLSASSISERRLRRDHRDGRTEHSRPGGPPFRRRGPYEAFCLRGQSPGFHANRPDYRAPTASLDSCSKTTGR
jgi:hypothetical protein